MKYHLYRIDWIDASSDGGWVNCDKLKLIDIKINSIGWLVKKNKNYYLLAQSLSSSGNCADRIQIPKKWITKVKKLTGNIIEYE